MFTVGRSCELAALPNPAHSEQGIVGDDEWSVFVLRDLRPFQVRTNQWERSFDRTAAGSRRDDDDKNKRNWLWLAREAWHQQDLFLPCFALLALEPTNHRTIWITCCHRRGWWETMFPFYVLFFFSVFKNKHFLCPAEASDWLFSLLRVFICFVSWIF